MWPDTAVAVVRAVEERRDGDVTKLEAEEEVPLLEDELDPPHVPC
jgi:hypothetical protein